MSVPRISALAPVALAVVALLAAGRAFPQSNAEAASAPSTAAVTASAVQPVPVVHAQACNAWMIHKQLMVRETMPGYGRLLAELP